MYKTLWLIVVIPALLACTTTERPESEAEVAAREAIAAQAVADAEAARIPPAEAKRQMAHFAKDVATASSLSIIGTINDRRLSPELRKNGLDMIRTFLLERSKPCSEVSAVQQSSDSATSKVSCAGGATYTVDMKTGKVF
jgi:hypothetical protein